MKNKTDNSAAIVLGLNDALVEITGTLIGLSFALQYAHLIGIVGLIMGVAASLSMAASEYLSSEETKQRKKALHNALYTGSAYFATVLLLVLPFFIFKKLSNAISFMIIDAILVIALYSLYSSRLHKKKFSKKFLEILIVSSSVAIVSFIVAWLIRSYLGVEI